MSNSSSPKLNVDCSGAGRGTDTNIEIEGGRSINDMKAKAAHSDNNTEKEKPIYNIKAKGGKTNIKAKGGNPTNSMKGIQVVTEIEHPKDLVRDFFY